MLATEIKRESKIRKESKAQKRIMRVKVERKYTKHRRRKTKRVEKAMYRKR